MSWFYHAYLKCKNSGKCIFLMHMGSNSGDGIAAKCPQFKICYLCLITTSPKSARIYRPSNFPWPTQEWIS